MMKTEKVTKSLDEFSFKVSLQNSNIGVEFVIKDKEKFLSSWRKRGLVEFVKPNGDIFSYELSNFYIMEIEELKQIGECDSSQL